MKRNLWRKIEKDMMYFSLQERENREHTRYVREYEKLDKLSHSELSSRYITTKASYEHNKAFFSLIVVALLISALSGVWNQFYDFCKSAFEFSVSANANAEEMANMAILLSVLILGFFVLVILIVLWANLERLFALNKKLLIIEEVRHHKNKGQE